MNKVSVTLTTCGRLDLLKRTLDSFYKFNNYDIDEFIIINDNPSVKLTNEQIDRPDITIINNETNLGQRESLDILFKLAKNEYIFHLEDDWEFDGSNNFIKNSIDILERYKTIHQVHVRHENDNPQKTLDDVFNRNDYTFSYLDPEFRGVWCGYSWNPGLRRKSDYLRMFPNGIVEHVDELECSKYVRKEFQYLTVLLFPTVCFHIGYGRTTNPHLT